MFFKRIEVPYPVFASSSPMKKKRGSGKEGKVPMPPLNNLSDFFQKTAILVSFKTN